MHFAPGNQFPAESKSQFMEIKKIIGVLSFGVSLLPAQSEKMKIAHLNHQVSNKVRR
jgi:hypothetical protein